MTQRFALLFFLLLPLCAHAAPSDQWNKHWKVGSGAELRIHAGDAAVEITGGNSDAIDASLTTRGWSIGSSGVQVTEHQMGNVVEIEVRVPSTHFSFGNHEVRLEVHVPRDLTSDIHTGDGSIRLQGLHGRQRVDTGDGSIAAEDLDGSLEAHTGDGSAHIRGRFDNLQLRTEDGSIQVDVLSGSRLQSAWRVQTGDGSVHVNLPHDLSADLDLQTGDGSIQLNLPVTVSSQHEHETHAKLNGGGLSLTIHTGDGSISVGS